jgi:hypothetical protein
MATIHNQNTAVKCEIKKNMIRLPKPSREHIHITGSGWSPVKVPRNRKAAGPVRKYKDVKQCQVMLLKHWTIPN